MMVEVFLQILLDSFYIDIALGPFLDIIAVGRRIQIMVKLPLEARSIVDQLVIELKVADFHQ